MAEAMTPWWKGRALRIYHPNPGEAELQDLDVRHFVEDCLATHAEAVVVSAGGIYAFYPSELPHHYVSPVIGDRDLLQEIIEAAEPTGLRIIARVDFSKAREDVLEAHPSWFARDADGAVKRSGKYYLTCPVAGYQNEAFAHQVIEEVLTRYPVAGFHINATGFPGVCHCAACRASFGEPIPKRPEADARVWERYIRWRREALADQLAGIYKTAQAIKPDVFFMGELAGQEYPEWEHSKGFHLPTLKGAFSQILVSSGGLAHACDSRWWVGMSADRVRAAGQRPIVNIKIHMRDLNVNATVMPPREFAFLAYQAIAHGAGLKLPTFGIPATLADARAIPAISDVLAFMEQQGALLDSMAMADQVGLVWPSRALSHRDLPDVVAAERLEREFAGLYTALKATHVQFRLIYDEALSEKRLADLDAVILPTASWLDDKQAQAVLSVAERGGRVILLDAPVAGEEGFRPIPISLANRLGRVFTRQSAEAPYALPGAALPSSLTAEAPLPLLCPYRRFVPASGTEVWFWTAYGEEMRVPEDADPLTSSEDALSVRVPVGTGDLIYLATGLGETVMALGHLDHLKLLSALVFGDGRIAPLLETDAPACVDVVLAQWQEDWVIHLVNAAGSTPLVDEVPVGPITLRIRLDEPMPVDTPCRVRWIAPGEPIQNLDCELKEDHLKVTVPRLRAYGQVVIS
ncbi:MAG: family 10 glycosylhydrolase [Anaerolineae bacterium]